MKRVLSVIILAFAVLSLSSCKGNKILTVDGSTEFTRETFPEICAVDYTENIAARYIEAALGKEARDLVSVESSSLSAYEKLVNRDCDIVIAHAPVGESKKLLEASGIALKSEPIYYDALVFYAIGEYGNIDLSASSVADIFSGKIKNYSETGGSDSAIIPQLPQDSYSSDFLFDIIESAQACQGSAIRLYTENGSYVGTTGYSGKSGVFSCCMLSQIETVKARYGALTVASVEGIMPDASDTDASQTALLYPFASYVSVQVRADTAAKSPTEIIYNWMTGEQGKKIAASLDEKYKLIK